tara:strand:- start:753 stop:1715 length:963 start_codon:yes stop_codon:yes gene_type:complete
VFNLRNTFLIISALLTFFIVITNHRISLQEDLIFEIKKGNSLQMVANELKKRDLILNHFFFILNAKIYNIDQKIKAGEYLLSKSESIFTLQKKFIKGDTFFRKLQLLEGMTTREILKLGNSEGIVDDINGDLEKFKLKLNIVGQAEGLLFPDTFYYQKGDLFSSLLKRAFDKQQIVYIDLWNSRQEDLPYSSLIEAITLASIIEKEGLEKEMIAGVFVNRLRKKMKLQSDPTVIFALGSKFDGNIKRSHLRIDNPYNTYRYKGLPPGPIGLVSLSSIEAALNPKQSEYLYFVSMNNGFHKFSKTLEEHNQAVLKYQINER